MSDIARHLEKAEKYLQKGRQDAALREYFEVLREDPAHETVSQAADLALSLGYRTEAATLLRQLLERQLATGSEVAVTTYRKLLKTASVSPDQSEQVARLTEKTNSRESLEAYREAVRGYVEAGRKAEALAAMEAIIALEPTVEHLCRLADLAVEGRNLKKAVAALLRAAGLLARVDDAGATALYERAWRSDPASVTAALAYARALLAHDSPADAAQAVVVLKPFAGGPVATPETRGAYGRALMTAGRITEIEPFLGDMLQQDPRQIDNLLLLVARMLDLDQIPAAIELARRLEEHQRYAGRLRHYAGLMRELAAKYASCALFQEYLVELFNATNRDHDYCEALLRLFELHYASGNFLRAGECLDRAAEVDPYEAGHKRRLDMLRGKLEHNRLLMISGRISSAVTADERQTGPVPGASVTAPEPQEATVLEDLMLQAEIFLQYALPKRAAERLERIRKVFPGEELRNEKLRALYTEAGLTVPPAPSVAGMSAEARVPDETSVNDLSRLTEIARSISRQGTARSVLFTAVNEAGRHWNVSRCLAVLCSPGKPPSLALEYCAPGVKPSDVSVTLTLIGLLYPVVIHHGPVTLPGNGKWPGAEALRSSAATLGSIRSLVAVPLIEGEEYIGLLLLAECGEARRWSATDTVALKTIADQIVLAVSNARLRRLVRSLAVTDEKSGLVKRSSYLDVLLSEAQRAAQQKSALTVVLLHFDGLSTVTSPVGDGAMEAMIQQAGQLVCSHIRQNDVAVRYDAATFALVLADTHERNAFFAIEHLRRLLSHSGLPGFTAGIAEACLRPGFDAADIVTELINRVESALQAASAEGVPERALAPPPCAAASV